MEKRPPVGTTLWIAEEHLYYSGGPGDPQIEFVIYPCEVYPVRPLICRAFICSRTLQAARKTRDLVQSDRDIHSLRWEIFKNPESIALIQAAQRAAAEK